MCSNVCMLSKGKGGRKKKDRFVNTERENDM